MEHTDSSDGGTEGHDQVIKGRRCVLHMLWITVTVVWMGVY